MDMDNIFGVSESAPVTDNAEETTAENTHETQESTPENAGQVEQAAGDQTDNTKDEQPLILGKFKSQADLENAYKNLEAEYTKARQQKPAPEKKEQPAQQTQQNDEEAQLMAWYEQAVQINPIQANIRLSQYLAKKEVENYKAQFENMPEIQNLRVQKTIQSVSQKYSDFGNYTDKIVEILAQGNGNPEDPATYEMAYYQAKVKSLEENAKTAFENGKKTAAENLQQKKSIVNEVNTKQTDTDSIPEGVTIIPEGDGIFKL